MVEAFRLFTHFVMLKIEDLLPFLSFDNEEKHSFLLEKFFDMKKFNTDLKFIFLIFFV